MPLESCSRWLLCAVVAFSVAAKSCSAANAGDSTPDADVTQSKPPVASASARFVTETLHGRIVWMAEAFERRYNIESDPDAAQAVIAVETDDGRLVPLVKDFRSRGFWVDPRLRTMNVEVLARRYAKSPAVQAIRWYEIREGRRYEVDYWCDICAIPMYELKTCECCQGETRLRQRLVQESNP
jgi:hypothetical protein